VVIGRYATAVVDDRYRPVDVNGDVDLVAKPGEGLVNRVVDDFVDEMMQARRSRRADVHRRPLADGVEPFEYFYFVGAVVLVDLIGGALFELDALVGVAHVRFPFTVYRLPSSCEANG
jgi:hypothetical protein